MAFIGIQIPQVIGQTLHNIKVPGKKEEISELHITLLNLEKEFPIKDLGKSMLAAYEVCKDFEPFVIDIKEVIFFPAEDGKPYPIVVKVEADKLQQLHKKLKASFDKHKVEYSKKFKDFKPHITLSYSKEKIHPFKIDELKIPINELVLWGGDHGNDRIFITFPLETKEENKKTSFIRQMSEIFYKLAVNKSQDHLTASFDKNL